MKNYIGVTLLFSKKSKGISVSDIISFKDKDDIRKNCQSLGEKFIEYYYKGYKYVGVSDVFFVKKTKLLGDFLGRTSYYELKTKKAAKGLCLDKSVFKNSIKAIKTEKVNVEMVYFFKGNKNEKGFSFIIYSVIPKRKLEKGGLQTFADSKEWKSVISKSSVEKIKTSSISFIGVHSLYKARNLGFNEMKCKDCSIKDMEKDILSSKEILEIIIDC